MKPKNQFRNLYETRNFSVNSIIIVVKTFIHNTIEVTTPRTHIKITRTKHHNNASINYDLIKTESAIRAKLTEFLQYVHCEMANERKLSQFSVLLRYMRMRVKVGFSSLSLLTLHFLCLPRSGTRSNCVHIRN